MLAAVDGCLAAVVVLGLADEPQPGEAPHDQRRAVEQVLV
jgi:hypothetical protein